MRPASMTGLVCAVLLLAATSAAAQGAPRGAPAAAEEPEPEEGAPPAKPKPKPKPKPQPQPKPKPEGPQPARALTVINGSANTALDVIVTGGSQSARLGKPLAANARATLRLPALKSCTVTVQAMFQGGGFVETEGFDVCTETSIRFTD